MGFLPSLFSPNITSAHSCIADISFCLAVLRSYHHFSISLRSGVGLSHLDYCLYVAFLLWICWCFVRLFSCFHLSLDTFSDLLQITFDCRMLCLQRSTCFRLCDCKVAVTAKQAMRLPPSCLTVCKTCLCLYAVLAQHYGVAVLITSHLSTSHS